jgi:hypothetical protein
VHDADGGAGHPEEDGRALDEPLRQGFGVAGREQHVALQVEELLETDGVEVRPCSAG